MNVQHSSRSDNWHTPDFVLDKVRLVLDHIDLDPASDNEANLRVKAMNFLTKADNSLITPWVGGTVFLNPPGGKTGKDSNTSLFWKKLMDYRISGKLEHAIFLAFSIEALQTTQNKGCKSIAEFPFCVPKTRIKFISPDDTTLNAPSHSNMIVYVPGTVNKTDEFYSIFKDLGNVLNTKRHP